MSLSRLELLILEQNQAQLGEEMLLQAMKSFPGSVAGDRHIVFNKSDAIPREQLSLTM